MPRATRTTTVCHVRNRSIAARKCSSRDSSKSAPAHDPTHGGGTPPETTAESYRRRGQAMVLFASARVPSRKLKAAEKRNPPRGHVLGSTTLFGL